MGQAHGQVSAHETRIILSQHKYEFASSERSKGGCMQLTLVWVASQVCSPCSCDVHSESLLSTLAPRSCPCQLCKGQCAHPRADSIVSHSECHHLDSPLCTGCSYVLYSTGSRQSCPDSMKDQVTKHPSPEKINSQSQLCKEHLGHHPLSFSDIYNHLNDYLLITGHHIGVITWAHNGLWGGMCAKQFVWVSRQWHWSE